jgi:hypothetical protein
MSVVEDLDDARGKAVTIRTEEWWMDKLQMLSAKSDEDVEDYIKRHAIIAPTARMLRAMVQLLRRPKEPECSCNNIRSISLEGIRALSFGL